MQPITYPVGVCNQMCPDDEITRRQENKLLHLLEYVPKFHPDFVVKEFSRSAAGRKTQNVKNLRTPDALLKTINYLLKDVIIRDDVPWHVIYDFISDRLRAVRQDMVIQNLPHSICIQLLEPMIKFYVLAAYRLCEASIRVFDPHINNTHLQECLKRLLCIYDEEEILNAKNQKTDLKHKKIFYAESRPIMESLYLILNMGNTVAMNRALNLPSHWKKPIVKKCLKLSIDCWERNYVRVCRDVYELPTLLLICAILHLPYIRKGLLAIMSVAYSCKNVSFPIVTLQSMLLYNNEEEVIHDCSYYGIEMKNSSAIFCKSTFNVTKPELPPTHSNYIDSILDADGLPCICLK